MFLNLSINRCCQVKKIYSSSNKSFSIEINYQLSYWKSTQFHADNTFVNIVLKTFKFFF